MAKKKTGAHGVFPGRHRDGKLRIYEHPEVKVDADPIFIRDRDVWTGAGLTACLDLALALVADDFGERLALRVARQLVMFLKRPSGQSQFSASLEPASKTRRMDALRHFIFNRFIGTT